MKSINNIVLIDDNKIDSFINQKIVALACEQTTVKVFNSGVTALDYFKEISKESGALHFFTTDLILLDINMPVLNGFEFLNELAKLDTFIKNPIDVFFLSSSNNENDMEDALETKFCSGYIIKPLTKDKFKKALASKNKQENNFTPIIEVMEKINLRDVS